MMFFFFYNQEISICILVWFSFVGEIFWDVLFVILNFLVLGLFIVISYFKILQVFLFRASRLNVIQVRGGGGGCCRWNLSIFSWKLFQVRVGLFQFTVQIYFFCNFEEREFGVLKKSYIFVIFVIIFLLIIKVIKVYYKKFKKDIQKCVIEIINLFYFFC